MSLQGEVRNFERRERRDRVHFGLESNTEKELDSELRAKRRAVVYSEVQFSVVIGGSDDCDK